MSNVRHDKILSGLAKAYRSMPDHLLTSTLNSVAATLDDSGLMRGREYYQAKLELLLKETDRREKETR